MGLILLMITVGYVFGWQYALLVFLAYWMLCEARG
jgi:hypothetical protein